MRRVPWILFVSATLLAVVVSCTKKPTWTPSEVQMLRLQVKQKDAQLAQQQMLIAQQAFQKAMADLQSEADKVEDENGWPRTSVFDPATLTFKPPVPAPTTPPAPIQSSPAGPKKP